MIDWHVDIIDDIARRRSVIFLGSGVSKNSSNAQGLRPMDWKEFLTFASAQTTQERFINGLIRNGDFLTACEMIRRNLGQDDFNNLVRSQFQTPAFIPADIHRHIYNLDSRIIATPNFDKIFDVYAEHISHGTITVKTYYDDDIASAIRRPDPVILKVHGTITSPDRLIFSRKDYSSARSEHKSFYQILDALSITHTFIFIGCGPNDPDIRMLLEDYTYRFRFRKKHFIVSARNSIKGGVLGVIEDTMSLKVITYDSRNNHIELTESLEKLVELVELRRQELAATMKW